MKSNRVGYGLAVVSLFLCAATPVLVFWLADSILVELAGRWFAMMVLAGVGTAGGLIVLRRQAARGSFTSQLEARVADRTTELTRLNQALRAGEQRYRSLAEAAQDFIFIIDRDDRVAYVNSYASHQFHCEPEQLIGRKRSELFPQADGILQKQHLDGIFATGQPMWSERTFQFPGGELILHTRLVPLPDENGQIVGVLGISRDMTESRRAAVALQASEEKYRTLVENLNVGVIRTALLPVPRFIHVNHACAAILGYDSVEELMALSPTELYLDPADRSRFLHELQTHGAVRNYEFRGKRKDGTLALVSCTVAATRNSDGMIETLDGVFEDVTERKRAEERLRLLSAAVEQSTEGIAVVTPVGDLLFANEAFASMHGLQLSDLPGGNLSLFHLPEQLDRVNHAYTEACRSGRFHGIIWHVRSDGRTFPTLMTVSTLRDPAGELIGLVGTALDISEQVEAETHCDRLSWAVENAGEGIGTFDETWTLTYVNTALAQIFGATRPADILGQELERLLDTDEQASFAEIRSALQDHDRWSGQIMGRGRDGRAIPLAVTLARMTESEGESLVIANIRDRSAEEAHLAQIRELTVAAAHGLEEERARLSRELHDELGQWLTAVNLNLAWLGARCESWDKPARDRITEVQELVGQMIEVVRSLSTSLRPPILDNRGLIEAVRSYAAEFARRASISCHVTATPSDLEVPDPLATPAFRIVQEALTNVARHSRATKCGISLKLEGSHIEIKVHDNGVGAVANRLAGVQSLGIAGMRERAAAIGGTLNIENRPEGGVCVVARLPWQTKSEMEE